MKDVRDWSLPKIDFKKQNTASFPLYPKSPQRDPSAYSGIGSGSAYTGSIFDAIFDGDKFPGGYGITKDYSFVDYWTLRTRSVQLFTENPYAAGLIKRLLTNEINTGLQLESTPEPSILGMDEDQANDWSENTETLFRIWGNNKQLADWRRQNTFGDFQRLVRQTAMLSGDCVVVLRQSAVTKLPIPELIDGTKIQSPMTGTAAKDAIGRGNRLVYGVELDKNNRHVAYFVIDATKKKGYVRIPVMGPKSKRQISFMVYGSDKRVDEVRGMPLLACVLQALKEIDRYKDSEQRAAVVNSMLAIFIKKGEDKISSRPLSGGAKRKDTEVVTQGDGTTKNYNLASWLPGTSIDELNQGEEPVSFNTMRPNQGFAAFEQAILSTIAWSQEIPPEILLLSFSSNYSASRAAINEFKIYLDRVRPKFASDFTKIFYREWLISMVLTDRITAPGFLDSWRDINQFQIFGAWIESDWSGAIKPSVDREKEVKAYERMLALGAITYDRATKELTGTKFSTNTRRLKKENEQLVEARQPLIDAGLVKTNATDQTAMIEDIVEDAMEQITGNENFKLLSIGDQK